MWWCHLVLQTEPKAGQLYVIYLETYFSFELWTPEEDASKDKSKFKVWADLWCVFLSDIHLTFLLCDVFFDTNVKIWCTLQQIHVFLFFIKDIYNCFLPQYIHQSTVLPRDSFSKSSASLPFPFLLNHICVSLPGWGICQLLLLFWQGFLRSNAFLKLFLFSLDFSQPSFYVFSSPSNDCENISCLPTDDGENVSHSPFQSIFWQVSLAIFFISDNENDEVQDLKLRG